MGEHTWHADKETLLLTNLVSRSLFMILMSQTMAISSDGLAIKRFCLWAIVLWAAKPDPRPIPACAIALQGLGCSQALVYARRARSRGASPRSMLMPVSTTYW